MSLWPNLDCYALFCPLGKKRRCSVTIQEKEYWRVLLFYLQAKALILKLTEEKNSAIQQNSKLKQELVRALIKFIYWFLCHCFVHSGNFSVLDCPFFCWRFIRIFVTFHSSAISDLEIFMFSSLSPFSCKEIQGFTRKKLSFIPWMIWEG